MTVFFLLIGFVEVFSIRHCSLVGFFSVQPHRRLASRAKQPTAFLLAPPSLPVAIAHPEAPQEMRNSHRSGCLVLPWVTNRMPLVGFSMEGELELLPSLLFFLCQALSLKLSSLPSFLLCFVFPLCVSHTRPRMVSFSSTFYCVPEPME